MNRFLIILTILMFSFTNNAPSKKETVGNAPYASFVFADTCIDFNSLNNKIRDGNISKPEALKQIQNLLPQIKNYFYKHGGQDIEKTYWIFPVQGYNSKTIGGTEGSGYNAEGYDYFNGNKHGGHPAHDIFINDKNQDCIDDISKKPINVLSMTAGIVLATETLWDTTSNLRGGKYIWIYESNSKSFFYYAHNSKVLVKPLDIVNPGDTIATVGRTGLNAFKKRSPTHLHIMQLKLDSNYFPKPVNCYKYLLRIKKL
jgi:murein DD-endopeptidase MepM/ murein hydrolase activator NlpD